MITLIEALHFGCLRYVSQPLAPFQVLVGPNASGKSTFLDVVAFLGDLVSNGVDDAVSARTANFRDLIWGGEGTGFELAIEAVAPEERRRQTADPTLDTVRYEVTIWIDPETGQNVIADERLLRKQPALPRIPLRFPEDLDPPSTLRIAKRKKKQHAVLTKTPGGKDNFYPETDKGWFPSMRFGPRKSALENLPDDESIFPVATWFKDLLTTGIQQMTLNSALMRRPSPPGNGRGFRPDGSNLPWAVARLAAEHPERLNRWIGHMRTALPDIQQIDTIERPEDRHRYLIVRYRNGMALPSWRVSDGTLRLLALTLPAYLTDTDGIYLVEEPENGIHPQAVETVYQSLSSEYDAQVLLATHSPVILSSARAQDILCFARTASGASAIVRGSEHPALADWKGEVNLSFYSPRGSWDEAPA
ncbi:MAG TPA: ATP-binding protein [Armatimonadota bacterium]|nr:ATP-binding protein [Armatimonadota bacterium]